MHTSLTACSIVSPARKMETPHILSVAARFPLYNTPCGVSTVTSYKYIYKIIYLNNEILFRLYFIDILAFTSKGKRDNAYSITKRIRRLE